MITSLSPAPWKGTFIKNKKPYINNVTLFCLGVLPNIIGGRILIKFWIVRLEAWVWWQHLKQVRGRTIQRKLWGGIVLHFYDWSLSRKQGQTAITQRSAAEQRTHEQLQELNSVFLCTALLRAGPSIPQLSPTAVTSQWRKYCALSVKSLLWEKSCGLASWPNRRKGD